MNFLTIHYFLTLVEERNFTRAAERLHVTQQTLSGHIAMVERESSNTRLRSMAGSMMNS